MDQQMTAKLEQHRPLVLTVLERYLEMNPKGNRFREELLAAGIRSLWLCLQRFDPTRGVQFSTYTYAQVMGSLRNAYRDFTVLSYCKDYRPTINYTDLAAAGEDSGHGLCITDTGPNQVDARDTISVLLKALPLPQRRLIDLVYLQGMTLEAAGHRLGFTKQRADQVRGDAMARLRQEAVERNMVAA